MRLLHLIIGLCMTGTALADAGPLLLEQAVHLETVAGDLAAAERIYQQLVQNAPARHRARGEAMFRLADLYARQAKNAEAKTLFLQMLRDFPEASDLIPLAELELTKVTALLTRDQIGTNMAFMQHIGDLVVALQGALQNNESQRATNLATSLATTLDSLSAGSDAPDIVKRFKTSATELQAILLQGRPGAMATALAQLNSSKDFEPFLQRGFPSDPHDVFAPAWRLRDRLAQAVAANSLDRTREMASTLERYLAPVATFPPGPKEGTLARMLSFTARDVRSLAEEGKFAEARTRLDEFDAERHEQYPDLRVVANLPIRMPEQAVAAAWAILFRTEMARRELSQRAYATAMDHVSEAIATCRDIQPRVESIEVAAYFKRQLDALEMALWEIKNDRLGPAQQALKRAMEKTP